MTSDTDLLDAVVVGAGWAGLGVSYYLGQAGLRHRVLERGRIGETWRTQRWDSFRMNTPNALSVMPGDTYDGPDPEGFMTRDAFVALLEGFAARNRLPVDSDTPVVDLACDERDNVYRLKTPRGALRAHNVVIASGSLNRPRRPAAAALPPGLLQMDASDYRDPAALPAGAVLVVGSAQCGGQIAEDLVQAGRGVFLATGRVGRLPRRYRGRDITFWLRRSGLYDVPRKDLLDATGHIAARPLLGVGHTISLQSLSAQGIVLLGRFTGVEVGTHLNFADDLEENIRFGDESSTAFKRYIDDYIAREGLDTPAAEPDPAETVAPRLPDPPIRSLDPVECGIATVIWCTGFEGDFGWVRVPGVLDARGQPVHEKGVAAPPGIYFAGLDLAITRKSGTLFALIEEPQLVVEHILARR
jgi:putative flavoprotein involved in K+ transport